MDPAGLALGLVGLAGLFNTCLDILDKFESWKECENESQALKAQFQAHKLQLEQWGHAVGIQNGSVSVHHDKHLDDPRVLKTVKDLLSAIHYICGPDGPHFPMESKRQRLSWALRTKMKQTAQVGQFGSIVQTLYSLLPIHKEVASRSDEPVKRSVTSAELTHVIQNQSDWIANFKRILVSIESDIEADERRELKIWLLGSYIPNDRYEFYTEKRIEGTCEWILSQSWFQDWSSPDDIAKRAKILWINGPAGFGKTILSTKIIDHLCSIPETNVSYFFFSTDSEREDPFVVVRTWICQIIDLPVAFQVVRKTWAVQQATIATRKDLMSLLHEVVMAVPGCTLIMDGLDECASDSIFNFIEALMKATQGTTARLLLLSRDEPEIRDSLYSHADSHSVVEHKITPEDVRVDVRSYSREIVYKELNKSTDATRNDLSQKLADRCNGQFLWVTLQQESLRRNSWRSPKEIEKRINSTPTGLESLYEQNWMKISSLPEEDRDRALSLLRWTAFSLRPLTVNEITEALLISETCDEVRIEEFPEIIDNDYIEKGLSYYCGSLLEIRSPQIGVEAGLKTVHLAHFSVKQYLIHSASSGRILQLNSGLGHFAEAAENTLLAKMCLRYVHFFATQRIERDRLRGFLFDYSARSWSQHFFLGEKKPSEMTRLVNSLFDINGSSWTQWREWFDLNHVERKNQNPETKGSLGGPVYYATLLGLVDTVEFLIKHKKHSANDIGPLGGSALAAASEAGHLGMAVTLLANGANVQAVDRFSQTALHSASSNGHLEVVKLLLDKGAEINATDDNDTTPLTLASGNGHLEIVELLLENDADIMKSAKDTWTPLTRSSYHYHGYADVGTLVLDSKTDPAIPSTNGWTPVHLACQNGHFEVVRLLLEKGADIKIVNKDCGTPLHSAAMNGHADIAQLLLEHDIDCLELHNNHGTTAVNTASYNGHLEVTRLLLEYGADISVPNKYSMTPLYSASVLGYLDVVRLLIEHGADPSVRNIDGWNPVNAASQYGHFEVVKALLQNGADLNVSDSLGWLPVHVAAQSGNLETVRLLIERGADLTAKSSTGWTALSSASENGHLEVVKLLLENGASSEVPDIEGWLPVHFACQNGHLEVVKLLTGNGASYGVSSTDGWTPIHMTAQGGFLDILKLLIENGANPAESTVDGWTPVHLASRNGHLDVVRFLLEKGIDATVKSSNGSTPLSLASLDGRLDVVKLLIEHGVDPAGSTIDGWTPVHLASRNGHLAVVEFFLGKGIDASVKSSTGWTPLGFASQGGHLETVKLLLKNGANPAATEIRGRTPIHLASENGHSEVVSHLLSLKQPLEIQDDFGRTPLLYASAAGQCEVVRLLLSHNALPSVQDRFGSTPLSVAIRNGHEDIAQVLIPLATSTVGFEDSLGRNLVWWATRTGKQNIIDPVILWADTMGVDVHKDDLGVDFHKENFPIQSDDSSDRYCDICIRVIPSSRPYHRCKSCHDFDICLDCHGLGAECLDVSHKWDMREADGSA